MARRPFGVEEGSVYATAGVEQRKEIEKKRRRYRADQRSMEQHANAGFVSGRFSHGHEAPEEKKEET